MCVTRFAQSEVKAYTVFLENLPLYYSELTTNRKGEDGDSELALLCDMRLVVTLLVVIDVLDQLTTLSLAMQTVNALPWELLEHSHKFAAHLQVMVDELHLAAPTATTFPGLCAALDDLNKGEFMAVPLVSEGEDIPDVFERICERLWQNLVRILFK